MLDQRLHQVLQILPTDQLCSPRARLRVAIAPLTADWVRIRTLRLTFNVSEVAIGRFVSPSQVSPRKAR